MLYLSRLVVKNWRNFRSADIPLETRMFFVGPNASGKSNILDAIRFLKDICRTGGGLRYAVMNVRGGLSKIRSLFARDPSDVVVGCDISDDSDSRVRWKYELVIKQAGGGIHNLYPIVKTERIWKGESLVFDKKRDEDQNDTRLQEYTRLEQPVANKEVREIADFLASVRYLHLVPQLVKASSPAFPSIGGEDYFGSDFIGRAAKLPGRTRDSYLKKIEKALQLAVPQFEGLELVSDEDGKPHLQTTFKHWRSQGARQWEDQFSDGTLRLVGFLWALLDGKGPLLLEEPELSLHSAIVTNLAEIIAKLQKREGGRRQIIATTHSIELMSNRGIAGEEVAALFPEAEGTSVRIASTMEEVRALLDAGLPIGEVVIPSTAPANATQLLLEL
jgi:predicted ATPase